MKTKSGKDFNKFVKFGNFGGKEIVFYKDPKESTILVSNEELEEYQEHELSKKNKDNANIIGLGHVLNESEPKNLT